MIYHSLEFATAKTTFTVFEHKIILKIVKELQYYIVDTPSKYTRIKTPQPDELIRMVVRGDFMRDCMKSYRHGRVTLQYLVGLQMVTQNGRKVTILNDVKFYYKKLYLDIHPDFFKLVMNFKTGVCGFTDEIFKLKNMYTVRWFQLLLLRHKISFNIQELRFMLNNEQKNKTNYILELRAFKEPQQFFKALNMQGFYYNVNYDKTGHHKKIVSVDLVSRLGAWVQIPQ